MKENYQDPNLTDVEQLQQFRNRLKGDPTLTDYFKDNDHWRSFSEVTAPLVSEYLGDEGFPVVVRLLDYERKGMVDRMLVYKMFVDIIHRGNERDKLSSNITHDMEGPTY